MMDPLPNCLSIWLTAICTARSFSEPVASLSGAIEIQGSYADVHIAWPAGFRAPLLVQARDGQVTWTLPEKPDSETTNGVTELRAFSNETGKSGIKVVTVHGDVQVDPAGR